MNARRLAAALERAAAVLDAASAHDAAAKLVRLGRRLAAAPAKATIGTVLERARREPSAAAGQERLGDLAGLLVALHGLLAAVAKAEVVAAVADIASFAAERPDLGLDALWRAEEAAPADADVAQFVRRLEAALGDDDAFTALLAEVEDDNARLSPASVIAIAKRFTSRSARSRTAAIKLIRGRHESLCAGRAKVGAVAGRTAA